MHLPNFIFVVASVDRKHGSIHKGTEDAASHTDDKYSEAKVYTNTPLQAGTSNTHRTETS